MLKRYLPCVLGLAASLALGSVAALAQDEAKQPESLSTTLLMDEELAPEESGFKIDPAILTPPENATAEELFEFVDALQNKLPQPTSQEELYELVNAFSKAMMTTADKLLAMEDLTAEQRDRAVQLKVVSLTTRANDDLEAAQELETFVDTNLAQAKTDEELLKAYQLKLQVLAASQDDPLGKINALADDAFQREQEELQIFAIEVRANVFISAVQRTGEFDADILTFVDGVIADEARSARVKEKAYEMKLVALVVADELEKGKEDAEERNEEYAKQAEELFTQLLSGDYSLNLKKTVYQLRIQTLMNTETPDADKLNAIADELAKQEDEELYALGISLKGEMLLRAAQEDKEAIAALAEYADKIVNEAKDNELLKIPSVGLKVQAFRLQDDNEGLLAYITEELAANPAEELKQNLIDLKLRLGVSMVAKDAAAFDLFKDFCEEYKDDERFAAGVAQLYSSRFTGALAQIQADGADLERYNAAVEQFKADLEVCPRAITALLMARMSIDAIGEANEKADLFDTTFDSIIDYCKTSDSEELNMLAQNLETYLMQMRETQEAMEKEAAEKEAAEKEAKAATEKKAVKAETKKAAPKTSANPAPKSK